MRLARALRVGRAKKPPDFARKGIRQYRLDLALLEV
jgi:hypothetical protein